MGKNLGKRYRNLCNPDPESAKGLKSENSLPKNKEGMELPNVQNPDK